MQQYQENTLAIENAPWWLNHSQVVVKEDMLAEDQEWITNQLARVVNPGTQFASMEVSAGSSNILLVKRMVMSGTVAVNRPNGRVKTVSLPQDAGKLLSQDLDYIVAQINKNNEPMSAQAQTDFLPPVSEPSVASLKRVR